MIARIREALRAAGYDPAPEELAEIVWLAAQNPPPPPGHQQSSAHRGPTARARPMPPPDRAEEDERPLTPGTRPARRGMRTLYASATLGTTSGGPTVTHTRVPAPRALPHARALSRALRPLRSTAPSRTAHELDIPATIATIADGLPDVVLRPARELLLDLTLVVDDGPSMPIWHDTAKELFHTLHRLRAFRRTRLLGMATDDPHTIRLTVEPFRLGAASATPITGENNLLLVLSDGIGEAWQSGAAQRQLAHWARRGPLAVLQVLPEDMWPNTGLPATRMMTKAPRPGVSNRHLTTRHPRLPRGLLPVPELAVPVIDVFTPVSAANWSRLVGAPGDEVAVPVVDVAEQFPHGSEPMPAVAPDHESYSTEQALDEFMGFASPLARRLAGHLACVAPLTIPVMRLVQRSAVPEARPGHLAEVFLAGLLAPYEEHQDTAEDEDIHVIPGYRSLPWDRRMYTFPPVVVGPLRELIKRSDEQATHELVSRYWAQRHEAATAGMALITSSTGVVRSSTDTPPLGTMEVPDPARTHTEPGAEATDTGPSAPLIFVSHAVAEEDSSLLRLFLDDLLDALATRLPDMPREEILDVTSAATGGLGAARVMLAMWSNAYFRSRRCLNEWEEFERPRRTTAHDGPFSSGMVPVMWEPLTLVGIDQSKTGYPVSPAATDDNGRGTGLLHVMNQDRDRHYRDFVVSVAERIVAAGQWDHPRVEAEDSAVHHVCVAVDAVLDSPMADSGLLDMRNFLSDITEEALRAAGVLPEERLRQDTGDGIVLAFPRDAGAGTARVVTRFIDALVNGLARFGTERLERLRLRVAMDRGVLEPGFEGLAGEAVVRTCRLLDAAPIRQTAREPAAPDLDLIMGDRLFEDMAAEEAWQWGEFTQVQVDAKGLRTRAWLRVYGTSRALRDAEVGVVESHAPRHSLKATTELMLVLREFRALRDLDTRELALELMARELDNRLPMRNHRVTDYFLAELAMECIDNPRVMLAVRETLAILAPGEAAALERLDAVMPGTMTVDDQATSALTVAEGKAVADTVGTDRWPALRRLVARIIGRGSTRRIAETAARLDRAAAEMQRVGRSEATTTTAQVASVWQAEFDDLLATLHATERAEATEQLHLVVELLSDQASAEDGRGGEEEL